MLREPTAASVLRKSCLAGFQLEEAHLVHHHKEWDSKALCLVLFEGARLDMVLKHFDPFVECFGQHPRLGQVQRNEGQALGRCAIVDGEIQQVRKSQLAFQGPNVQPIEQICTPPPKQPIPDRLDWRRQAESRGTGRTIILFTQKYVKVGIVERNTATTAFCPFDEILALQTCYKRRFARISFPLKWSERARCSAACAASPMMMRRYRVSRGFWLAEAGTFWRPAPAPAARCSPFHFRSRLGSKAARA